eukprot:2456964-Prymnesium_polylepis.1
MPSGWQHRLNGITCNELAGSNLTRRQQALLPAAQSSSARRGDELSLEPAVAVAESHRLGQRYRQLRSERSRRRCSMYARRSRRVLSDDAGGAELTDVNLATAGCWRPQHVGVSPR